MDSTLLKMPWSKKEAAAGQWQWWYQEAYWFVRYLSPNIPGDIDILWVPVPGLILAYIFKYTFWATWYTFLAKLKLMIIDGISPYKPSIWGTPIFGNPQIYPPSFTEHMCEERDILNSKWFQSLQTGMRAPIPLSVATVVTRHWRTPVMEVPIISYPYCMVLLGRAMLYMDGSENCEYIHVGGS